MYYVICHQNGVELRSGLPVVTQPAYLLTAYRMEASGRRTDEIGLLLFSDRERAQRWLTFSGRLGYSPATFSDTAELQQALQFYMERGYRWVILDRQSSAGDEQTLDIRQIAGEG